MEKISQALAGGGAEKDQQLHVKTSAIYCVWYILIGPSYQAVTGPADECEKWLNKTVSLVAKQNLQKTTSASLAAWCDIAFFPHFCFLLCRERELCRSSANVSDKESTK